MYRFGFHSHTMPGGLIRAVANASGVAQGYLGPAPAGYCWYVERMTTFCATSAATPKLEVFSMPQQAVDSSFSATAGDRTGRQDLSLAAGNDISDENSPVYVPEGYYLVAVWTGLTSGDVAQLSTQIAVHQLSIVEYGGTTLDIAVERLGAVQGAVERANTPQPHNYSA